MRFGGVDYPEEASEYSDDEDLAASQQTIALDWIRFSYDDLSLDSKTGRTDMQDRISAIKILSRSVEDIFNCYGDRFVRLSSMR